MYRRPTAALALGLALAFLVPAPTAQTPPSPPMATPLLREAFPEAPTAGTLGGIRTVPIEPFEIESDGTGLPLPDAWETDPVTGAQFRRGELLVKFAADSSKAEKAQSLLAVGAQRMSSLPNGWDQVAIEAPALVAMSELKTRSNVLAVHLNYRLNTYQHRPNDEYYSLQWNFDSISLPHAWEINPGATAEVVVAVIDTGLNFETSNVIFNSPYGQIPVRFAAIPATCGVAIEVP